ncbi:MAG: MauE/DoxX family redox-associated membrane protein [Ktedonobacteraceae bacterium]
MHFPIDIAAARLFLRLLFGLILLSSGTGKLVHSQQFRQSIQDYHLVPSKLEARLPVSIVLSFVIPIAELLASLGLLSGFWLVSSVVLAVSLFVVFSGAMAINLLRGRHDLSCHCGGVVGNHLISWWLVVRNVLFVASLLVVLVTSSDVFTVEAVVQHPSVLQGNFIGVVLPVAILVGGTLMLFMLFNATRLLWDSEESFGSKNL